MSEEQRARRRAIQQVMKAEIELIELEGQARGMNYPRQNFDWWNYEAGGASPADKLRVRMKKAKATLVTRLEEALAALDEEPCQD